MIKIALVGPESTGKSTLCNFLSIEFNAICISEYAREYLNNLNRPYVQKDLDVIAEKQLELISKGISSNRKVLFSDTEFLVLKLWSEVKYGSCSELILNLFHQQKFDLYLLCNTDVKWQRDPLREMSIESERHRIYDLFKLNLERNKLNYEIITGEGESRNQLALNIVKQFVNSI